jgi:hypothetical protein
MTDAIDLRAAVLTPGDVRDWPATTAITALRTSVNGLDVEFSARDGSAWPDVTPAGWDGPVYYTVWLGARLPDGVHLAAALNVYRGQAPGSGAGDVTELGQYATNLWYLDPALKAHAVTDGETLYLMVTAGGWRGVKAPTVQARSNVVAFRASRAALSIAFAAGAGDPPVVGDPPAPPIDPGHPSPAADDVILAAFKVLEAKIDAVAVAVAAQHAPTYAGTVTIPYLGTGTVTLTPKP